MSDEPLAREPLARERALRCSIQADRQALPSSSHAERPVQGSQRQAGPRTPEGLERSKRARWKHGYYSREAKVERSRVRAAILALRYLRMLGH